MNKVAVFPGSFDPFTIGHHNLVTKALQLFDQVIVAIGQNSTKMPMFPTEQRLASIKKLYNNQPGVSVVTFNGLTVDLCQQYKAGFILRGLRNGIDFEYEKAIAHMNKKMTGNIETIFLLTEPEFESVSSTIVREIHKNGGDITAFLPQGFSL